MVRQQAQAAGREAYSSLRLDQVARRPAEQDAQGEGDGLARGALRPGDQHGHHPQRQLAGSELVAPDEGGMCACRRAPKNITGGIPWQLRLDSSALLTV